jgi:hypothetical protein
MCDSEIKFRFMARHDEASLARLEVETIGDCCLSEGSSPA